MLSAVEMNRLSELESVIRAGLQGFFEAGQALKAIRDQKLYGSEFDTFEDYCNSRWQIGRKRAWELMSASEAVRELSATADVLPQNERQVRELKTLPPQERAAAWQAACTIAEDQPTSEQVRQAVTAVKESKTVKAAPVVEVGQKLTVTAPKSPYFGAEVEVVDVTGVIVRARTADGDEPFLTSELGLVPKQPQRNWTTAPTKTDKLEALESTLQIEQLRTGALEQMLQRLIVAARAGAITTKLLAEAEALLN